MATGKLAGQVLEVVVLSCGRPEHGGDAEGEGVAADAGEVFAEQVSCSPGIAGGCGGDHFDVVALPVHLLVTGTLARRSGDGVEVGDGEPEGRVGVDGEPQRRGGRAESAARCACRYRAAARRFAVTTRPWTSTAGPAAARWSWRLGFSSRIGCMSARLPGCAEVAPR